MHGALRQGAIKVRDRCSSSAMLVHDIIQLPSDTHVSEAAHGKGLRHRAAVYVLGALATALTLALVASVTWLFTLDAPHTCGGSHLDKRHVHHHLVRRDAGYDTGKGYELPDESLAFPKPVNVSAGRFPKYDALLKGNKEWIDSVNATDPSLFEEMGSGQSPPVSGATCSAERACSRGSRQFLYIGCADSRVPFSVITEQHPGQVCPSAWSRVSVWLTALAQIFVQRNAGNQYLYWDENSMTSLGFSVEVLGISSILVVGHTGASRDACAVTLALTVVIS